MTDPTIYLAGPIRHAAEPNGWRADIGDRFAGEFLNPLERFDARSAPIGPDTVVEGDLDLLRESDAVLVGWSPVRSVGTAMEVMWARERDMPVVLWLRVGDVDDLSPWYRYHCGIETSLDDAIARLRREVTDDG